MYPSSACCSSAAFRGLTPGGAVGLRLLGLLRLRRPLLRGLRQRGGRRPRLRLLVLPEAGHQRLGIHLVLVRLLQKICSDVDYSTKG